MGSNRLDLYSLYLSTPLMYFHLKPATHLEILCADRGENRKLCPVCAAIPIFAGRRDRRIKTPISCMSDIGDLIRRHSPSVPVPAIFHSHRCKSPVKSTIQVGRFYHMTFQKAPRWSPGTRLKCHIVAIDRRKNRQVCPHQSVAKIASDFRWRSNSP